MKWYEELGITTHYYADESVCIIHGDCREVLPSVLGKSIDLVFTSPPFNLGDTHHTGNHRHKAYADNLLENEYQDWQVSVLSDLYRTVSDTGSCWYQHKNRIKGGVSITPYLWILRTEWVVKQEFDKIRFYPMTERLYWLAKSPKRSLSE